MIEHKTVIGIDVGEKNIHGAVYYADDFYVIHDNNVRKPQEFSDVLYEIGELIQNLKGNDTIGVGISFPEDVASSEISHLSQETGLPIFTDTNVNLFTLAEYEKNWKQQTKNFVGVFLGNTLRTGVILNGELSHSHGGFANANHPEAQNFHREFEDFMTGEKGSKELMGQYIGSYLGNLVRDYKPGVVAIAGPRWKDFKKVQRHVWEELRLRNVAEDTNKLLIEVSKLQNASTLGAAMLAAKEVSV